MPPASKNVRRFIVEGAVDLTEQRANEPRLHGRKCATDRVALGHAESDENPLAILECLGQARLHDKDRANANDHRTLDGGQRAQPIWCQAFAPASLRLLLLLEWNPFPRRCVCQESNDGAELEEKEMMRQMILRDDVDARFESIFESVKTRLNKRCAKGIESVMQIS